ncbi:MAG: HPF/RaiA family ribosome-associated protein [Ectothiorhodospiraceae bacterium]|nr:HPF/RaiA family ribosome-associated protein [Ectothiorhodospiraceae bacterium]
MQIQLNSAQGVAMSPALEEHINKHLQSVDRRFGQRLTRIEVYLTDVNGPKGGVNKQCKLEARPRGGDPLMAESLHENAYDAVSGAVKRLESVLGNHFGKLDRRPSGNRQSPLADGEGEED